MKMMLKLSVVLALVLGTAPAALACEGVADCDCDHAQAETAAEQAPHDCTGDCNHAEVHSGCPHAQAAQEAETEGHECDGNCAGDCQHAQTDPDTELTDTADSPAPEHACPHHQAAPAPEETPAETPDENPGS